jgi:ABC-type nitrate/sulfonate/bicarbonate transport system substrate-binding protein
MGKRIAFLAAAVFAMVFVWESSVPAQQQALQTVRLVGLPSIPLPVIIGTANGTFAKFGIEVKAVKATDAAALRSALAAGSVDIAHSSAENAVAMVDSAQADVILVVGGEISTSELIVQPGVASVKDLGGRVTITDGPDTAYTLTLKKILLRNGLNPGVDTEIKVIGLAPQRLQAMQDHKEYAATIQKPPISILSKRAGLLSLGATNELLHEGASQGISGFVVRKWAVENRKLLERYLAAFIESQRWMMAPENKEAVIAILIKELRLAPDVAAETYDGFLKHAWSPDARFDVAAFKITLALRTPAKDASPSPDKYYDSSYYENSVALLRDYK